MGSAASLSSMRMSSKEMFNSSSVDGNPLPAPMELQSEEEALRAGYSPSQINAYKTSFEFFERTNQERGRCTEKSIHNDQQPSTLRNSSIMLENLRGASGRKTSEVSRWTQCGGLHMGERIVLFLIVLFLCCLFTMIYHVIHKHSCRL